MQGASQKSVLVVEDDAATAAFLADNLRADGFGVWCASEAGEALRAADLRQPDLLLLDLGLEAGSGFDVLDRVRSADAASSRVDPDLPVILLTGRSGEVDRVRGFARGADDYLCKPTASLFAVSASGSRRKIGSHVSSTPATTSSRGHGMTSQTPTVRGFTP